MDYSLIILMTALFLVSTSAIPSLDVQPSPVATVTEGSVLWLTCTYDLDGGTLGQLVWKGNDGGTVAIVTPTATPPCSTSFPADYTPDCSQLSSNEVRLRILTPVHRDTYSCRVYLSDFTLIGTVSTQVSVVVPVPSVTFTPPISDTVTVTPGGSQTYTCVTGSCLPQARIEWYRDGVNVTTQTGSFSSDGDMFVTTSSYTLTGAKGDSPATVQCRASNVDGMVAVQSDIKSFVVRGEPTIFVSPLENPYIIKEAQTNVTLTCAVTDPPVTSILWRKESTLVSSTGIYIIPIVRHNSAGVYTCFATNEVGTSTANITLTVISIPRIPQLLGITEVTSSTFRIKVAAADPDSLTVNITYTCNECVETKWKYMDITATKHTYSTTITGLRPTNLYNLSITAANSAGSSGQLRLQVSTSPACESVSLLASDPSTDTATALITVGVVCTVVGLMCCGIGAIMYWKSRIVSRTDNRRKLETFSNAIEISPENNDENTQESSHYQELQYLDIGKPSLYDHIVSADDSGVPKAERCSTADEWDRSEQQQHTVTDHDYSNVK